MFFHAAALAGLVAVTHATFILQVPTSIGYDASKENQVPCGSFSATNRTTVTNWPVAGAPVQLSTTNTSSTWDIKAALLNNPNSFSNLIPTVSSKGNGTLCLSNVPANSSWAGQDAILQVTQRVGEGTFYQCAAIKFITGNAASVPGSCVNSTGVTASYNSTGSSSSAVPSSSSRPASSGASSVSASGTARPASTGVSSTPSSARASTTPSSSARTNGTTTSTARPSQFTGAAVAQNVDILVGGLAALVALAL